jgi:hypothetical protein
MTHDQLKSAIRQRMAETGEPYTTARREHLRSREAPGDQASRAGVPGVPYLAAVLRDAAAARQAALDLAARPAGLEEIERDAAAAQRAAADLAASAAGLGNVVAAHRAALHLAGDSADLTDAQRDAARQAAADLATSAAGLAEVAAAHQAAFEHVAGSIDLPDVEQGVATANQAALDLAHSSAEFTDQLTATRGAGPSAGHS